MAPQISLISVVVCTRDRPDQLRRALESVLPQKAVDDIPVEVIVVDDGVRSALELPRNAQIRAIRTITRGVGNARAVGLDQSRGDVVTYCDDDDEWLPGHLFELTQYLRDHPSIDLVYSDSEWVRDGVTSGVPYSFNFDGRLLEEMNYIFPSDVAHRAGAARQVGGFDRELESLEDWDLWLRMSQRSLLRHIPHVTARRHSIDDAVSSQVDWDTWSLVHDDHQQRLTRLGSRARHDMVLDQGAPAQFDGSTWAKGLRELVWHSTFERDQGYGSVGRQLAMAIAARGVDVRWAFSRNQPPTELERYFRQFDGRGRIGFYYDYRVAPSALPCPVVVNYSMWESTLVPPDHVDEINLTAKLQLVPCHENVAAFVQCGVRVPVRVLHHGINSKRFPLLHRPDRDHFTFGTFGDLAPRKGIDVLMRAFLDEFRPSEDVRLAMKSNKPLDVPDDPRIEVVTNFLDDAALLDFLERLDVYVLPSRGEGFGLTGLEAMATGLPLIATNWSGPVEYLDPADSHPLAYKLVPARMSNGVRYFGEWAEPDYEHLRQLMRQSVENRAETRDMGLRAGRRVHRNWTWEKAARQLIGYLDELAEGYTPSTRPI